MIFSTRPCAALLLAAGLLSAGSASAGDSLAAQTLSHGIRQDKSERSRLDGFDYTLPSAWTIGTGTSRVDGRFIDNGRVAMSRYGGDLDLGVHHDLDHAMSVMLHAGDGHAAGSGNPLWDWRDLKAGLNRKLDSGWLLALNYTRAIGAAVPGDRYSMASARADERPVFLNTGRKALVLSMRRTF